MRVQFEWPIEMLVVRNLSEALGRSVGFARGRIARLLFCFHKGTPVVLHDRFICLRL